MLLPYRGGFVIVRKFFHFFMPMCLEYYKTSKNHIF